VVAAAPFTNSGFPRISTSHAPEARFDYLLTLPEIADIGARVNAAMREIEKFNPQLAGVLPKTWNLFTSTLLKELATLDHDAFGRIYEYFLGAFAMTEGQGWSLNPGRYVGVAPGDEVSDEDFKEQFKTLNEELEALNGEALELQARIAQNVASLLS
jgi:type I restriction-modification system DNA methylase subunit